MGLYDRSVCLNLVELLPGNLRVETPRAWFLEPLRGVLLESDFGTG